jgi:hypothetical protein
LRRGDSQLRARLCIALRGESPANSRGESRSVGSERSLPVSPGIILERGKGVAKIVGCTESIECKRSPVACIGSVRRIWETLTDVTEQLCGAPILAAIQGLSRQTV